MTTVVVCHVIPGTYIIVKPKPLTAQNMNVE